MKKTTKNTPLGAFEYLKRKLQVSNTTYRSDYLDIVESAIKDYQLHKEILNDYGFTLANFREACLVLAQFRGIGFTGIEKKLKALEIIKEKKVAVDEFIRCCKKENKLLFPLEEYNNFAGDNNSLNLEEYALLKEVLL